MTGKQAEQYVAEFFSKQGYWVHITGGYQQPFDMVAIGKHDEYFVDIKHCKGKRFSFYRVENNQFEAMEYLYMMFRATSKIGFIIVHDRKLYFLPFNKYLVMKHDGLKSVSVDELKIFLKR